jgi:hypothetical protein
MSEFLSPSQARDKYNLESKYFAPRSEIEQALMQAGIAAIEMPLSGSDFQRLSNGMAVCLDECPSLLQQTLYQADGRYGSEAGFVRKEKKIDASSGLQTADAKSYFHFTESARDGWREQLAGGPKVMRDFLEDGFEVHDILVGVAKAIVSDLESSHPNMNRLYFPHGDSFSFLRLLRYDGYEPRASMGEVAKPHYDIGGITIQAYADAPGFWAAKDGVHGERQHYDTNEHEAYTFLGKGHEKVYGAADNLQPLWHGVDRIVPAGTTYVPERTAAILFVDAPNVDYHVRPADTLPHILGGKALACTG